MKKLYKLFTIIAAISFAFTIFSLNTAEAINKGIQISPLTYNFSIKQGESQKAKIVVKNNQSTTTNYICETENFAQVSDAGAPSFTGIPKQDGLTTLADWITFVDPKEGALNPGESKEINFTINVPKGAEPGGHYAAVFAKSVNKTPEGKVELGVSSRVGTLMLVSIPGKVKTSAQITSFSSPRFVWRGPVTMSMTVKNTGTIHYDSTSNINIKPIIGKTSDFSIGKHTIIPNNSRSYEGKWNKRFPFGRYDITASATDGTGKSISTTTILWAVPLEIVIPVIVGIILIIVLIRYFTKHLRFVQ